MVKALPELMLVSPPVAWVSASVIVPSNSLALTVVDKAPVTPFLCGGMPLTFGGIH